jgi:citrate synthase
MNKSTNINISVEEESNTMSLSKMEPNIGPSALDIRRLYSEQGLFTYDPGFTATASCQSKITYIDGEKGILLHRGYNVKELAKKSTFLEVAYLLLNGELPSKEEMQSFSKEIAGNNNLSSKTRQFFNGFEKNSHPMALLCSITAALSASYHDDLDNTDKNQRIQNSIRLIAKMPTIAAMSHRYLSDLDIIEPSQDLSYTRNMLNMIFGNFDKDSTLNDTVEKAIDRILILHADHEQNASTSTVRLAGSSYANPFACVAAGIGSLWGPYHGGANEAVLKMLGEIESKDNISKYLKKAKDKSDPFKLMGFGHRVYKNHDPRATVLKESCDEVLDALGVNDPLLKLAKELETIALEDEYFINKKLFPNVDFYSGIILKAIGIPTSMFTVLFAVARTTGWVSQWKEMLEDPHQKIGRPRQLYMGKTERNYTNIDNRDN